MGEHDGSIMNPVTPGEILVEEFLQPLGMSQAGLARGLGVSPNRIAEIVHGRRGISADTALRLGLFFGTTPRFWLALQADHDLAVAQAALRPEDAAAIRARRAA